MRWIVTPVVAMVIVGMAGGATARPAAPNDGLIAYQGNEKIYVINADGSGRRPIITNAGDAPFAWSPDAQQIAFMPEVPGPRSWVSDAKINVAAADGTGVRLLTRGPSETAAMPTWSPDGKQIAFTAWNDEEQRWAIYVIGADGKDMRMLTRRGDDQSPDWSRDGRWIVFERGLAGLKSMMVVHPDGTGLHRIARLIGGPQCLCADWSPDGSKIAYQASTSVAMERFPEIFVMNADGSGRTQLTRNRIRDENPDWSPDGTRIAFYSERFGNAEIFVIDANGRNLKRLTRDPWYSSLPMWRPSG